MQDSEIPEELFEALKLHKPGAAMDFAAAVFRSLLNRCPLEGHDVKLVELACKVLEDESLAARLAVLERKPPEPKVDDFPDVERRGLLHTLGLRFYVTKGENGRDLFTVAGDVPDVEEGVEGRWSHARWRKPGESNDDALRASIIEFFEHETDHGLWRDGKHIRDPHEGEDPHAL